MQEENKGFDALTTMDIKLWLSNSWEYSRQACALLERPFSSAAVAVEMFVTTLFTEQFSTVSGRKLTVGQTEEIGYLSDHIDGVEKLKGVDWGTVVEELEGVHEDTRWMRVYYRTDSDGAARMYLDRGVPFPAVDYEVWLSNRADGVAVFNDDPEYAEDMPSVVLLRVPRFLLKKVSEHEGGEIVYTMSAREVWPIFFA